MRQLARQRGRHVGPAAHAGEGRLEPVERGEVARLQLEDALQRRRQQQLLAQSIAIERHQLKEHGHALAVVATGVQLLVLERVGERAPALAAVEHARQRPPRRALRRIGGARLAPGLDRALDRLRLADLARRLDERPLLVADDLGVAPIGERVVEEDDERAVERDAARPLEVDGGARQVVLGVPGDGAAEERGVHDGVIVERGGGQDGVDRAQELVPVATRGV